MFHQAGVLLIGKIMTLPAVRPGCRDAAPVSTYSCSAALAYRGIFTDPSTALTEPASPSRRTSSLSISPRRGRYFAVTCATYSAESRPSLHWRVVVASRNWTVSFDDGFGLPLAWKLLKNPRAIQEPASRSRVRARACVFSVTNRNFE